MLNPSQADGGLNYWADQTDIQIKAVGAWALRAEGKAEEALRAMRAAADHEDSTDKAAVTPGPIKPAREQLGEMLAGAKRPAEALAEFKRAMAKEPNRLRAMLGAAQSADATAIGRRRAATTANLPRCWRARMPAIRRRRERRPPPTDRCCAIRPA